MPKPRLKKPKPHWEPKEPVVRTWQCECGNDMFLIRLSPRDGVYLECVDNDCNLCYGINASNNNVLLL